MTDTAFGLATIGQILIPVSDVARATAFYRDRLGVRFLFGFPGMAFFDADGVRLYLAEPEEPGFGGHTTLYFRVPDIASAVAELEGRGVVFTHPPHVVHRDGTSELWLAFTKDPDDNNIGLMSEVPDVRHGDAATVGAIEAHYLAIGRDEDAAGAIYADDAVLEYVQSGERIRGRAAIVATRKAYPGPPAAFSVKRVSGSGDNWAAELVLRFEGEDPHFVAAILELRNGAVTREALYIAEPWEPPAYRAGWVER